MILSKLFSRLIDRLTLFFRIDINYFLKNGAWLYLSYVISVATGILLTFIYGNYLLPKTFGQLNFVLSFFSIIGIFSLPGMGQALTHAISNKFEGNFIKAIKQTLTFSIIGCFCLLIATIYFLNKEPDIVNSLILLLLLFPFISISTYYQSFLISQKKFKTLAIINILSFSFGALSTSFTILLNLPLAIIIASSLLPSLLINIFQTIRTIQRKHNKAVSEPFNKLGWHLSAIQSIHFLTKNSDKLILGVMLPFNSLGVYSFGLIIPDQINNLIKQVTPLLMPKVSQLSDKDIKRTLLQKFTLMVIGMLILILTYIILAPIIFSNFFPLYKSSIQLTQIYAISLIYIPTTILNLILQRYRQNQFFYIQEILYFIVLIILMLLFINNFGLIGAVIAQVIARMFYILITLVYFYNFIQKL